jgi:hypothetical protein
MASMSHKRPKKHGPKRSDIRKDANCLIPTTLTDAIVQKVMNCPAVNQGHRDVKLSYLQSQFLTKFVSDDTDSPDVRMQRAINKWLAVECDNDATNTRLLLLPAEYNILPRVTWSSFVQYTQRSVAQLLGETVPLDALLGAFSGGASTTRSRTESHPAQKYLGKAEITSAARKWFDIVYEESCLWACFSEQLEIQEIPGNKLFTVPKSTEIDRCACKEPDLNMYLQKGVGNYIRRRLRTVGINLNDQTINQRLAREGSITGQLATIDLSSASDSVSSGIVQLLLPDLWFGLMDDLRSPYTFVAGEWHKNHMFSSMGNGFTFELESLLFWAIAKSVRHFMRGGGIISVYGDDIIVGTEYVQELIWVLGVFGFSVNIDKSFTSGPFRESCGGHYHDGNDISPFFLRRPLKRVRDAIILANQIRKWSEFPYGGILDPTLEEAWLLLREVVPEELRGGVNLESDSQLVSSDIPRKRLMAVTQKRDNGAGGYLLWQNTCEGSEGGRDVIVSSSRKVESQFYVARRVNAEVRRPPCIFPWELQKDTEGLEK